MRLHYQLKDDVLTDSNLTEADAQLKVLNGRLDKLYMALKTGHVDMADLGPRIKALRAARGRPFCCSSTISRPISQLETTWAVLTDRAAPARADSMISRIRSWSAVGFLLFMITVAYQKNEKPSRRRASFHPRPNSARIRRSSKREGPFIRIFLRPVERDEGRKAAPARRGLQRRSRRQNRADSKLVGRGTLAPRPRVPRQTRGLSGAYQERALATMRSRRITRSPRSWTSRI